MTVTSSRPPDHCPNANKPCSGTIFRRFGQPKKRVRDLHVHQVRAQRWQCTVCGHVFRVYPQGVTHRQQSLRLQALSVLFWTLGMSLGGVSDALWALGCGIERTTVHDNLQRAGAAVRRQRRAWLRSRVSVSVVAMDCTHLTRQGREQIMMHASDARSGMTIEIMVLHAEDERTIRRYVQRMAALTGCEVILSDDADTYKAAADAAGVLHQVCQQHVVPNTLTLVSEIAAQLEKPAADRLCPAGLSVTQALEDLALLEEVILARAPGSQRHLDDLARRYQVAPGPVKGKRASPWYRLRLLTLDLAEDWPRLTLTERYRSDDGQRVVPATNNVSERGIGLNIKERYRTMRGYKSKTSLSCYPLLTAHLREQQGSECFSSLLAA